MKYQYKTAEVTTDDGSFIINYITSDKDPNYQSIGATLKITNSQDILVEPQHLNLVLSTLSQAHTAGFFKAKHDPIFVHDFDLTLYRLAYELLSELSLIEADEEASS